MSVLEKCWWFIEDLLKELEICEERSNRFEKVDSFLF